MKNDHELRDLEAQLSSLWNAAQLPTSLQSPGAPAGAHGLKVDPLLRALRHGEPRGRAPASLGAALGGSPDTNAARNQIVSTLSGQYSNPWANTWNPFAVSANPMLENVVQKSMGDITSNYMKSIAPRTDTMFARSGVFGGSAYNDRVNQNQSALGQTLANASNQLRFQDYGQQAQLAESALQGVRIFPAVSLRFPEEGSSAQG